jgi:hypothetical protein
MKYYYLVSSAMFDEDSLSEECVLDEKTGIVYNRYGDDYLINAETSIVYEKLEEGRTITRNLSKSGVTGTYHIESI